MRKPLVGDLFAFDGSDREQYYQYVAESAEMGSLIRVLTNEGVSSADNPRLETMFYCFYPLRTALFHKLAREVGHIDHKGPFPVFRSGLPDRDGRVETWWLWDGAKEWCVEKLKPAQRLYPFKEIISHDVLVTRAAENWRPDRHPLNPS